MVRRILSNDEGDLFEEEMRKQILEESDREAERVWEAVELAEHAERLGVPELLVSSLTNYVVFRLPPGSFFEAVFSNDLFGAFGAGDRVARNALTALVTCIYNHAPGACWGSPDKFRQWLAGR